MGFSGSSLSRTLEVDRGRGFYLKRQGADAVIGGLSRPTPTGGCGTLPKMSTRWVCIDDLEAASDDDLSRQQDT